jgi:ferrous-iron efflux pump FieF
MDRTTTPPGSDRARLLRLATGASVATAMLLIGAKLGAWLLTGAVSVLASLVDSLMDAAASAINLLAVRLSLQPADAEHRFGHGKAEPLAGLAQATFIAGSALFLLLQAAERLLHPRPLEALGVGLGVMAFAIAATLALLALQRHVIRRTGSTAIRADSLHYATDLLTNGSILLALGLAQLGWPVVDPVFALGVAAYILYSAWRIGLEALQLLMDRELPGATRRAILDAALAQDQVLGAHDLRSRSSGQTVFVQLHVELDGDLSLRRAHAVGAAVAERIRAVVPEAEVLIHTDPVSPAPRSAPPASPSRLY